MSFMNKIDRLEAVNAAAIFLERMEALEKSELYPGYGGTKESGAARRASMELTRALAKLRKYS